MGGNCWKPSVWPGRMLTHGDTADLHQTINYRSVGRSSSWPFLRMHVLDQGHPHSCASASWSINCSYSLPQPTTPSWCAKSWDTSGGNGAWFCHDFEYSSTHRASHKPSTKDCIYVNTQVCINYRSTVFNTVSCRHYWGRGNHVSIFPWRSHNTYH